MKMISRRKILASVALIALVVPLAACSSGAGDNGATGSSTEEQSQESGAAEGSEASETAEDTTSDPIEISFLTWNADDDVIMAEALIKAFQEAQDTVTVRLETFPAGTEGDNLVKTRLATDEMEDVFLYNSGAFLFQLQPDKTLQTITDEPWVADYTDVMRSVVSTDAGVYGTPLGSGFAGAVLYNKAVYQELGLTVPQSWAEFAANNKAIQEAGKTAVIQTYGDPWSAQLLMLGDFGNVVVQDPDWGTEFTAHNRKFVDQPALQGFLNLENGFKNNWWNEDYASATYDQGLAMLATGEGVHYPMLTSVAPAIEQNYPEAMDDIGVFAVPAQDATNTRLTVWMPNSLYIPKTTQGEKLAAVKKFLTFIMSPEGCDVQNTVRPPSGAYGTTACSPPEASFGFVKDVQEYSDRGATAPAQEFVTPVKGPSLPEITVEVGSGITSAADGAALYDADLVKAAEQLGLPGW